MRARGGVALLVLCTALSLCGCGKKRTATPAETRLEREDLVAVARALKSVERPVEQETASTTAAWPFVLDGVPSRPSSTARRQIGSAVKNAAALPLPALLSEQGAASLTGPASPLAGRYRDFQELASASWKQLGAALGVVERGGSGAAFARANAPLYIEGIDDAHYSLGETAKEVMEAYETLGGAAVLGAVLSEREVQQLAQTYSRSRERLQPRPRVKLGS